MAAAGPQRGPEPENVRRIFDLIGLRMPAGGRGGFGGFGGFAPEQGTGSYLVTLKVGDKTFKQVLKIERVSGGDGGGGFPFGEERD